MRKKMLIPMIAATAMFFGCASADEGLNDTGAVADTTISETQTMAGDIDYDTYEEVFATTTNPVEYDEMFNDIENTEQYDVLALARTNPNLTVFLQLVDRADLVSDLQRLERYTIFAPTNEAFAELSREKMAMLLMPENKAQLMQLLQSHVLPTGVSKLELEDNARIQMTDDTYLPVAVDFNRTNITVGNALILRSAEASNGYLHVVEDVILPSDDAREEYIGY